MRLRIWSGVAAALGVLVAVLAFLSVKGAPPVSTSNAIAYPVRGIDISHHQGAIDWRRIASQNIRLPG